MPQTVTVDIPPAGVLADIPPPPSAKAPTMPWAGEDPSSLASIPLPPSTAPEKPAPPRLVPPTAPTTVTADGVQVSEAETPLAVGARTTPKDLPAVTGPVTPELVAQAGFPQAEAGDWAAFANWLTKDEAHSFNQLYGTDTFTSFADHPANAGWAGGVGPDGSPTSAAGLFQDQKGTWNGIRQRYGLKDFSPVSQVAGNLRFAADTYKERTGRSLLADWKEGKTDAIAAVLGDQWSSLLGGGSAAGGGGLAASDPAFQQYRAIQQQGIDRLSQEVAKLSTEAQAAPAGSEERHALLRRSMSRLDDLSQRYEKLSQHPPQPQTPFQAANNFTPLMIALVGFAGAFTRRPALGAINAIGSALGALKQGNDENYRSAVDLWSKQTDFAQRAFQMQNEEVRDIMEDRRLAESERQNKLMDAFRILGLQKDLELAKGGLWKEVYERQERRQTLNSTLALQKAQTEAALALRDQRRALAEGGGTHVGTEASFISEAIKAKREELGREPTPAEKQEVEASAHKEWAQAASEGRGRHVGTEEAFIADALKAEEEKLGRAPTAAERHEIEASAHKQWAQASSEGRTAGSAAGQFEHAIEERMKAANRAAGRDPELTPEQLAQAKKEAGLFRHQAGATGNKQIDLQNQVDMLGYGLQSIDETFDILKQYGAVTGLGGRLTRPLETMGNIIGASNCVGRRDFLSHIEYLQMLAPRLMAGTTARPLSREAERINQIIAGLNLGDTAQRTVQSLTELRQLYTDMRRQHLSQIQGTWSPIAVPEAPGTRSPYTPGAAASPTPTEGGAPLPAGAPVGAGGASGWDFAPLVQ